MFLFVAHDAGPANYLGFIAKTIGGNSRYIASDTSRDVFESHGIPAVQGQDYNQVKLVVTGTCTNEGVDKEFVIKAREWGVPSVSVIEHWSWFRKRFTLGQDLILPDHIVVNDKVAKRKCMEEGLDGGRIVELGNPVLENAYLHRKPIIKDEFLRENYGFAKGKPIASFISESLREDFPVGSPYHLGFDEYEALRDIADACNHHGFELFVKLHPAESEHKYLELSTQKRFRVFSSMPKSDVFSLSDVMFGMGSMLLLEASVAGVERIVSYRPNETLPFIGNEIGATTSISTREMLREFLINPWDKSSSINFGQTFIGSTDRIVDFLRTLLK